MNRDIALLQETELFSGLRIEQIAKVLDIAKKVDFAAEEIVMREGDVGDEMYVILNGTVEVVKSLILSSIYEDEEAEKKNKVFTRLDEKNHAVFGEISLLEGQKRTATIKTVTDCSLYRISRNDFLALAGKDPELGFGIMFNLAKILAARLRKADDDTIKLTTALSIIVKES
ncbi:MAG: cyclic nucleotide-binding domain-containing protein [Smithellaceae bacterium]|nr:cyclic nucleotide-binding domain-containing protein [Smithellaceae bacterium]